MSLQQGQPAAPGATLEKALPAGREGDASPLLSPTETPPGCCPFQDKRDMDLL